MKTLRWWAIIWISAAMFFFYVGLRDFGLAAMIIAIVNTVGSTVIRELKSDTVVVDQKVENQHSEGWPQCENAGRN